MTTFQIANGTVQVGDQSPIRGGMTTSDIEAAGFRLEREIDMKTGWVFKMARPVEVAGMSMGLAFGLEHDRLRRVDMVIQIITDLETLLGLHNAFLLHALGNPTEIKSGGYRYVYEWGTITSVTDPRARSSDIIISWR